MEFFDASTQLPHEREWVRPVEPIEVPFPSLPIATMTYLLMGGALSVAVCQVVDLIVLPPLPATYVVKPLIIGWFVAMAMFQYAAVYQRSYVAAGIVLVQLMPLVFVVTGIGLMLVMNYEREVATAVAVFALLLPLFGFCLLEYDWMQTLLKYYRASKDQRYMPRYSGHHAFLFLVMATLTAGVAFIYYQARADGLMFPNFPFPI